MLSDDKVGAANVPLPGWKNISNKKRPFCIRVFWIVAVVVSIVACSFQILERVDHFKSSKLSVALNVDVDAHLPLPHVVVCPPRTDAACNVTSTDSLSLFWDQLKLIDNNSVSSTLKDAFKVTKNFYRIKYYKSVLGTCIVFQYETPLNMTSAALAEIHFSPRAGAANENCWRRHAFSITLHESEIVNDHDLLLGSEGEFGGYIQFSISVRKNFALNTPENVCGASSDFHQCRQKCVAKLMARAASCRLPFVDESWGLAECSSLKDVKMALGNVHEALEYHNWTNCNCVKPCKSTLFESTYHSFSFEKAGHLFVNINFQDSQLQTIREYESYTLSSFICDLGGTLALFLGFCLLTILEILDALFFNVKSTINLSKLRSKINHAM